MSVHRYASGGANLQPPYQLPPDVAKPINPASPPRGFSDGAAVELVGVTVAVAGLAFGEAAPVVCTLGIVVALIGLMMHLGKI